MSDLIPGLFNPLEPTEEEVLYGVLREQLAIPETRNAALIELASHTTDNCFVQKRSLLFRAQVGPSDARAVLEMCNNFIQFEVFPFMPSDFDIDKGLTGSHLDSSSFESIAIRMIGTGQSVDSWIPVPMSPDKHYDINLVNPDTVSRMHQRQWLHQTDEGWTLSQQALISIASSGNGKFLSPVVRQAFSEWYANYLGVVNLQRSIHRLADSWEWEAKQLDPSNCYQTLSRKQNRSDGHKLPFLIGALNSDFIGDSMAYVRSLQLETMIVDRIENLRSASHAKEALPHVTNKELCSRIEAVVQTSEP